MVHDALGNGASRGLEWLKEQEQETIKDISRSIQALSLWNEPASFLVEKLLSLKKDGYWETQTPLTDTARAFIALCECGKVQPETIRWIQEQQRDDNWNNSEIDTAYALMALGECRIKNENGCNWLVSNYGKKWEHPGNNFSYNHCAFYPGQTKISRFYKRSCKVAAFKKRRRGLDIYRNKQPCYPGFDPCRDKG